MFSLFPYGETAGPKLGAFVGAATPTKITMPSPPGFEVRSTSPDGFQLFAAQIFPAISALTEVKRIKGK